MAVWDSIATKRLRIVPFEERHLTQAYVGWLNDPQVVRYSEQRHRRHDLTSCRVYFETILRSDDFFCAIEEAERGLGHIGNISITVDKSNGVADIAIVIGARDVWGRGYGLEAWSGVLATLLKREGMRKVSAGTVESNLAMIEIMRRSGMVEDGRRRMHLVIEGTAVDVVHYAAFARQWNSEIKAHFER